MINVQNLDILDTFRFISLSSKFEEIDTILIGRWIVYNQSDDYNDNAEIVFEKDGAISYSSFSKKQKERIEENGWSFVEHIGRDQATQNSFNVLGMSTMEIVYIDENIIYAKGYADNRVLFIKEEAKDIFKSSDDVLLFFAKIENFWNSDLNRMRSLVPENLIKWHRGPQIFVVLVVAYLISGYVGDKTGIFGTIISFLLVCLIAVACTIFITKLLLMRWLNKYRTAHPEDKLANHITIDLLT